MLQIKIIAVGKLKEKYLLAAQAEYLKRLKPYAKVEIKETPDLPCPEKYSPAQEEQVIKAEGEMILRHIQEHDYLVALDRNGKQLDSLEFAGLLREREVLSAPLALVIGGSMGLAAEVLQKADLKLSFSKLTFPHQLFRVILLEQIYRACKINRGEKYHK